MIEKLFWHTHVEGTKKEIVLIQVLLLSLSGQSDNNTQPSAAFVFTHEERRV